MKGKDGARHVKQTDMTWKQSSPCSLPKMVAPEDISCPQCKAETEVWPDDEEAVCGSCGCRLETVKSL